MNDISFETMQNLKEDFAKNGKETKPIEFADEKFAFYCCGLFKVENIYDAFVVFASATLCNSYIKAKYAEKGVKHKHTFKKFVREHINELAKNPIKDVSVYANDEFSVIDICGLKFSYHSVGGLATNCSYKDANKVWSIDSLRLNPHANQLFDMAKDYIKTGKVSKNNQIIAERIQKDLINADKEEAKTIIDDIMGVN